MSPTFNCTIACRIVNNKLCCCRTPPAKLPYHTGPIGFQVISGPVLRSLACIARGPLSDIKPTGLICPYITPYTARWLTRSLRRSVTSRSVLAPLGDVDTCPCIVAYPVLTPLGDVKHYIARWWQLSLRRSVTSRPVLAPLGDLLVLSYVRTHI